VPTGRNSAQLFPIIYGQFLFYLTSGELSVALEIAEGMLEMATRSGDRTSTWIGHYMIGVARLHMARFAMALETWRRALALYDADENRRVTLAFGTNLGAHLLAYLSWALLAVGAIDEAIQRDRDAVAEAGILPRVSSAAGVFLSSCLFSQLHSDRQAVEAKVEPLLALCAEQKIPFWMAGAIICQGWVMAEAGETEKGMA
jgi:tetratricopeptide (TPR) repeat protein